MVGALRIIFVLINTRIRQMAPPSDLGQRRVTGIVDAPLEHVVCLGGGSYWAAVHLLLGRGPLLGYKIGPSTLYSAAAAL